MPAGSLIQPAIDTPPAAGYTRYVIDGATLYGVERFNFGKWRFHYGESTSAAIDPPGPTCEEIGSAVWSYAERTLTP